MLSASTTETAPRRTLARTIATLLTGALTVGLVFTSGVAAAHADAPTLAVTDLQTGGRTNPATRTAMSLSART